MAAPAKGSSQAGRSIRPGRRQSRAIAGPNRSAGIPRTVNGVSYVVGEPDLNEQQLAEFIGR